MHSPKRPEMQPWQAVPSLALLPRSHGSYRGCLTCTNSFCFEPVNLPPREVLGTASMTMSRRLSEDLAKRLGPHFQNCCDLLCLVRKFPPTHYHEHVEGSGTAPPSLGAAQFSLGLTADQLFGERRAHGREWVPEAFSVPSSSRQDRAIISRGSISWAAFTMPYQPWRPASCTCRSSTLPFAVISLIYQQHS